MKWNELEPDIKAKSLGTIVRKWSFIDAISLISETNDLPLIIMNDEVRSKIYVHLKTKRVELGGLLLGSVISSCDLEDGITVVSISDAVASRDFNSTSVSLSMNSGVWQHATEISDESTFVVGWYHSHPNLGAFFSGTDRSTQANFFHHPYSLGLVVDPIRNEEKWFLGADSIEVNPQRVKGNLNGMALV